MIKIPKKSMMNLGDVPLDCVAVICSFISDHKDFRNVFLTIRGFYGYLRRNKGVFSHIKYPVLTPPPERNHGYPFVQSIHIDNDNFSETVLPVFQRFRNIEIAEIQLRLSQYNFGTCHFLRKLKICVSNDSEMNITECRMLEDLEISTIRFFNFYDLVLSVSPRLRRLRLERINLKVRDGGNPLRNSSTLECLEYVDSFSRSYDGYVPVNNILFPSLKKVEIRYTPSFTLCCESVDNGSLEKFNLEFRMERPKERGGAVFEMDWEKFAENKLKKLSIMQPDIDPTHLFNMTSKLTDLKSLEIRATFSLRKEETIPHVIRLPQLEELYIDQFYWFDVTDCPKLRTLKMYFGRRLSRPESAITCKLKNLPQLEVLETWFGGDKYTTFDIVGELPNFESYILNNYSSQTFPRGFPQEMVKKLVLDTSCHLDQFFIDGREFKKLKEVEIRRDFDNNDSDLHLRETPFLGGFRNFSPGGELKKIRVGIVHGEDIQLFGDLGGLSDVSWKIVLWGEIDEDDMKPIMYKKILHRGEEGRSLRKFWRYSQKGERSIISVVTIQKKKKIYVCILKNHFLNKTNQNLKKNLKKKQKTK